MKIRFGLYVILLTVFIFSVNSYAQVYLTSRLTAEQAININDSTSTANKYIGTAAFILDNEGLRYVITVNPSNVDTTIIDSSKVLNNVTLYMGAMGDTGQVVTTLSDSSQQSRNTISGIWSSTGNNGLTNELRQALVRGQIYIIATTSSGKIRGQIEPTSGTGFVAYLTSPQEADSIVANSTGVGSFLLTDVGLIYLISVQDIDISASHFHRGAPGVSGPIVQPIQFNNGHTAMGIWTPNDANPFNTQMKKELLVENLYVNVHSPQFPGGEIRGQVLHAGGFGFSSPLTSAHAGMSDSTRRTSGNASYVLTDAGLVIHINVNSRDSVTSVYFANSNGGQSLKSIDSFKTGTFSDVWFTNQNDNSNALTDQNISDLLKGNMSLNVVTMSDTLSGQIMLHKQTNFTAMLSGPQEIPRNNSTATGLGHFELTDQGLSYYITLSGIDKISAAHFHLAPIGVPGGVVHPITFDSNMVASGTWSMTGDSLGNLTNDMVNAFLEGKIYVNVHTPSHPAGEIRGQVLLSSGTDFKAHLTGTQETPPIRNTTMGTGNFILTNEGLVFKITVDSLKMTAAHFHLASAGVPGGVVKTITPDFQDSIKTSGNTAVGIWRRTGDVQPLTDSLINSLLTGDIYVNVHTAAHPGGEIRGQVLLNGGTGFVSIFDTSATNTMAAGVLGSGSYSLTDAGLIFKAAVNANSIKSASINLGPSGQTGSVVHDITTNFQGSSVKGAWLMLNDSSAVDNLSALFTNGLSLNVQSSSLPVGNLSGTITRGFTPTVVSVTQTKQIPNKFKLDQNYPNPFNPSTVIKFSIPERGAVNLSVYNLLGEKITTLINDQLNTGSYSVTFDASNFASGVYFYRLSFGNNIVTRKMMFLK